MDSKWQDRWPPPWIWFEIGKQEARNSGEIFIFSVKMAWIEIQEVSVKEYGLDSTRFGDLGLISLWISRWNLVFCFQGRDLDLGILFQIWLVKFWSIERKWIIKWRTLRNISDLEKQFWVSYTSDWEGKDQQKDVHQLFYGNGIDMNLVKSGILFEETTFEIIFWGLKMKAVPLSIRDTYLYNPRGDGVGGSCKEKVREAFMFFSMNLDEISGVFWLIKEFWVSISGRWNKFLFGDDEDGENDGYSNRRNYGGLQVLPVKIYGLQRWINFKGYKSKYKA